MSGAFLALWNEYPASLTEEYEVWHTHEHVPERLTAPGMIWARRYGDFAQPNNYYFTLYGLNDLEVLKEPAYLDLVRRPTDWSSSMRRHFLNVLRIPATGFAASGNGFGGCLLAQAYSIEKVRAKANSDRLARSLRHLIATGQILGFRIGLAEPNQPYEVFTQLDIADPDSLNVVIMIEGTSRSALEVEKRNIGAAITEALGPARCFRDGIFNLLVSYQSTEFARDRHSVAASDTLRSKFSSCSVDVPGSFLEDRER